MCGTKIRKCLFWPNYCLPLLRYPPLSKRISKNDDDDEADDGDGAVDNDDDDVLLIIFILFFALPVARIAQRSWAKGIIRTGPTVLNLQESEVDDSAEEEEENYSC